MRLFTAINIPPDVLGNLERLLGRLRPTAQIKWSPPGNLHITTRFIGEWPEARQDELRQALTAVPKHDPIAIGIRNLGFFPNPHAPRVFWAGIHAPPDLASLAGEIDRALARLGIAPEKRAFSPHLTLARITLDRIKEHQPLAKLQQTIAALDSLDFGSFTADRFYLYQSRLQPSGSVYTKLSEFPLSK